MIRYEAKKWNYVTFEFWGVHFNAFILKAKKSDLSFNTNSLRSSAYSAGLDPMLSSRSLEEITETACCRIPWFSRVHAIVEIWGNDHHLKNRVFFSFTATTLKQKQNEWLQNLEFSNPLFEERSKMAHHSLLKKSYTLFVGPCLERKRKNRLVHCLMESKFPMRFPFWIP